MTAQPQTSSPSTNLTIQRLEPAMESAWEDFVDACPDATFFHRAGWKRVLEQALGHKGYYLYAESGGRIRGVLPLGHVKTLLFGNALISVPFCVYGGVAAADAEAEQALIQAAQDLAEELQVDYLELRHRERRLPEWPCKDDLYVTFRKPIDPDPDVNMKAIPRKQRAMVRKGIKRELASERDTGIDRFFPIYADSVRRHGTPVFARRFFQALMDEFGEAAQVTTVSHEGQPVSSVLSFLFRDEVLPYYGGGTPEARDLAAFDFLYWEVMRRASQEGYRLFDYGRSKRGTGSFSFKKNWGFEPEPLYYEYHLVRAKDVPDINPLNPKYRLFIAGWKRLPLPVANVLGPVISRGLG
ncbi:FemAB family PEP-CTERM system-associated protein [Ectothiorhodospira haloalkaliphila]|uniref:FemAB family XrtA/PEP-CTERM system-associated protein n=1 Tax=Ectothiorhodospira haloalkaliphila TaxID=421628 RepID=UPI001EE8E763|nr:FemAB family XrtA/PEP-CTERM system-associated protein [Ectothiorhodospira haloalkaliphila]MCG5524364.1 FemAB family PEP-CTERM system-associated protein [Ectothiorhodospira haloalkaliphila]